MANSLIFDVKLHGGYQTIVFTCDPLEGSQAIASTITKHISKGGLCSNLNLFGPACLEGRLTELSKDDQLIGQLPLSETNHPIGIIGFDALGRIQQSGREVNDDLRRTICRQGITHLVAENEALVDTSETFHFVKPSGRHARRFLRAADIFRNRNELAFIGLWLLPKLSNIQCIHCDTASIIPIVQEALFWRNQLSEQSHNEAVPIFSFGSYGNLDEWDFGVPGAALVVVSASTSGGLKSQLTKSYKIPTQNIVTLLSIDPDSHDAETICNVSLDDDNPRGQQSIRNWKSHDCEECQRGSVAIHIKGDSFFPALPAERTLILKKAHAPKWLSDFLLLSSKNQIIGGFSRGHSTDSDVTFNFAELFSNLKNEVRGTAISQIFARIVPAAVENIVVSNLPGSNNLADLLVEFLRSYRGQGRAEIDTWKIEDLRKGGSGLTSWKGCALIVCGSLTLAKELLAISRLLRETNCQLVYIIGLSALFDSRATNQLVSDLEYRSDGEKNGVHELIRIHLPATSSRAKLSWHAELDLLNRWLANSQMEWSSDSLAAINFRKDWLSVVVQDTVIRSDGIFWNSPKDESLKLRGNFALVDFSTATGLLSQAEVYFAVLATLHNVRSGSEAGSRIFTAVNQRLVLAPRNFDRFNDAVIQASLLRAAHAVEIDYRFSDALSEEMVETVSYMAECYKNEEASALPEILISLASKRMRLAEESWKNLLQRLKEVSEDVDFPSIVRDLVKALPPD